MKSAFDELREDEYAIAHEAAQLGMLLLNKIDAHAELLEAKVAYVFRDAEVTDGGKVVAASAHLAQFHFKYWARFVRWSISQMVGFEPDFIMLIDRNMWDGYDERQKLALVDHELCHMRQKRTAEGDPMFNQQTGEPLWMIAAHDIEEFNDVIERHGLWNE